MTADPDDFDIVCANWEKAMAEHNERIRKAERERVLDIIEHHQNLLDAAPFPLMLVAMAEFVQRIREEGGNG